MENTEITALTTQVTADALAHWTDDKRKEFIRTFDQRVRASQVILLLTANIILTKAEEKQFVAQARARSMQEEIHAQNTDSLYDPSPLSSNLESNLHYRSVGRSGYWNDRGVAGGRSTKDLTAIAQERANLILQNLPPLKEAVGIISPETAELIEQRDELFEQGKELLKQADALSGSLDMDDFDSKMTLGQFKTEIKSREKKRKALLDKLSEVGQSGKELEKKINKFLYSGIPGLSDAVLRVVEGILERFAALSTLFRRVSEQVQFGDSKAALEVLSSFERDEITVSDEIKAQFTKALDALKLGATPHPQTPKRLKSKK